MTFELEQIRKQNNILRDEIKQKEEFRLYKIEKRELIRKRNSLTLQNKFYPLFLLGREIGNTAKSMWVLSLVILSSVLAFFIGIGNGLVK